MSSEPCSGVTIRRGLQPPLKYPCQTAAGSVEIRTELVIRANFLRQAANKTSVNAILKFHDRKMKFIVRVIGRFMMSYLMELFCN